MFQALREELLAAKESVVRQYERAGYDLGQRSPIRECTLCGCANLDVIEEHTLSAWAEYPQSLSEVTIDVCASCHRVLVKFCEKKALPTSEQSSTLLKKYLSQFGELLSVEGRDELANFVTS